MLSKWNDSHIIPVRLIKKTTSKKEYKYNINPFEKLAYRLKRMERKPSPRYW